MVASPTSYLEIAPFATVYPPFHDHPLETAHHGVDGSSNHY